MITSTLVSIQPVASPCKSLDDATAFICAARKVSAFIPPQTLECLILIAKRPGIATAELVELTGLSQASISRNLMKLSEFGRNKEPGLGLVMAVDDPTERRRRIMFLTPKGHATVTRMMKDVDPSFRLREVPVRETIDLIYQLSGSAR